MNKQAVVPSKIVCVGRNYVDHIDELGNEVPQEMVVFIKPNSAISAELHSFHQEQLHYEAELCFHYNNGRFDAVGFGLDLTKRTLQSKLKDKGLPWERAKAFNGSAVFSEFVAIAELNTNLNLELRINDILTQQGGIESMIYKPKEILAELATFIELQDGDIIMTGTPKGVGVINQGDTFSARINCGSQTLTSAHWLAK